MRFYGSGFVAYSPYYSLASALSPGGTVDPAVVDGPSPSVQPPITAPDPTATAVDYSLVRRSAYTSSTLGGFTYRLGQYSSLSMSGRTQRTDFVEATAPSLHAWDARVRYSHQISRGTSVHVGYGRRVARFTSTTLNAPVQLEDIDIGIDHSRASVCAFDLGRRADIADLSVDDIHRAVVNGSLRRARQYGRGRKDRAVVHFSCCTARNQHGECRQRDTK